MSACNSEALLISKDGAVLRIMTRALGEAAFNTTICTESGRLEELGMDDSFSLFVLDCPVGSVLKSMQLLDMGGSSRPRILILMNPSDALTPEISGPGDIVLTKPIGIRKARECIRRLLSSGRAQTCVDVVNRPEVLSFPASDERPVEPLN